MYILMSYFVLCDMYYVVQIMPLYGFFHVFTLLCTIVFAQSAKARGKRMEGSYINKSLLTLGTVIHKLSEGRAAHVPFRDSKLTRLLQPSLSGSGAKVAIICTVTPASAQAEETNNTLKFAQRAKRVRCNPEPQHQFLFLILVSCGFLLLLSMFRLCGEFQVLFLLVPGSFWCL